MSSHTKSNNINDSYLVQLTPPTYSPTSKNPTYNLHGKRLYYILLFFSSLDLIIAIGGFIFHLFTSKKNINSGVLVKFPKKKQDLRIDLPTVGLNTFKQCKSAGLKGIILKSKLNIFLEKKACINFANKNKIFILVK